MHILVMGLVMTVNTCGDIFMLPAVAFHTGHLAVFGLQGCQGGCFILMASGTELNDDRIVKDYIERTMGFMTLQTIFQCHFRSMPLMTIQTGLILPLLQAVLRMTRIAVLLGMSTWVCGQLVDLFLMATCAGGTGVV